MRRMFLASSIALPCLIALGLNCSADDSVVKPPAASGTTSATTGGSGGATGAATTTSTTTGNPATGPTTTSTTGTAGAAGSGGAATTTSTVAAGGSGGAGTGGSGGATGGAGGGTGGAGGAGPACTAGGMDFSSCFTGAGARVFNGATPMNMTSNAYEGFASLDGAFNIDTGSTFSGSDGFQNYSNGAPACVGSDVAGMQNPWKEMHWQLNGPGIVMGQTYTVSVRMFGVVECKTYNGGTGPGRMDTQRVANITQLHDLWISGGTDNGDHWNTYAFTVTAAPSVAVAGIGKASAGTPPDAAHTYFFNQCPVGAIEDHFTWRLDATMNLTVKGGEWINYVEFDSNCRMIINCGATNAGSACPADPQQLNNVPIPSTVVPAAPASLAITAQPPVSGANVHGQWWFLDVTGVK